MMRLLSVALGAAAAVLSGVVLSAPPAVREVPPAMPAGPAQSVGERSNPVLSPAPGDPAPTAGGDASGFQVTTIALRNGGFDAPKEARRPCPTAWFCAMHADPTSFKFEVVANPDGNQHLRVTRMLPEPWAMGRQRVNLSTRGGERVRLSMLVNTEGTDGEAGPKIFVNDGFGNPLVTRSGLAKRASGWRRVAVEADITSEARGVEVAFVVEGGGVTLFDDVRVELLTPRAQP